VAQRALSCFEKLSDGSWICQQDATIAGLSCKVAVRRGQRFSKGSTFAGYDDFASYLTSMITTLPDKSPREWYAPSVGGFVI